VNDLDRAARRPDARFDGGDLDCGKACSA